MSRKPASPVDTLAEELFEAELAASPFTATMLGVRGYDARVPDLSEDAEAARAAQLKELGRRAAEIDQTPLSAQEQVTLAVVRFFAAAQLAEVEARYPEFSAGPFFVGPQAQVLLYVPKVVLAEPVHAEAYLERCAQLDRFLAQGAERLSAGVAQGRTPPFKAVADSIEQLDAYLLGGLEADPLWLVPPPAGWTRAESWRERLAAVLTEVVRPAMARFRDVLAAEILPAARPQERSGLCWLPGGEEVYAQAIRQHTTTDLRAEEIHDLGVELVATLAQEYAELGARVLDTTVTADIFHRLRDDPALRFSTSEQVEAAAREAVARASAAAPAWFARVPASACTVEPIPALEARSAVLAYYQPPAVDGSRPGTYFVNTSEPTTRTRFEAEAVAFHEAVPGHHFQVALAQQLTDLPRLRRLAFISAYTEGWALYTERLADEMGLYSDDLARFGMLSCDSLRACRLVIDTGLHAKGWSRAQAVDYLRANSPQAFNAIDNEVDRYIAWPGQALSYMVGRVELRRLRESAHAALGARFDLAAFHDVVLSSGALPLAVLRDVVDAWVAEQRQMDDQSRAAT